MSGTLREWAAALPDEPAPDGATPAATLMVFRRRNDALEILMVKRARKLRFAGGAMVFPGGRVDPGDGALAREMLPGIPAGWAAAHVAAIRETLEETGLLVGLAQQVTRADAERARARLLETGDFSGVLRGEGWTLDTDALTPFARWCPPAGTSRVFDTRFFIADIGTGAVAVSADGTESDSLLWAPADVLMAQHARGEIALVHPTIRNLERVAAFTDYPAIEAHARTIAPRIVRPHISETDGARYISIPSGLGYSDDRIPFREI
ncbi:NUDIX domain-containing protein [uncultured Croceicoccus sp.]|uniref:NUDIX hydrolase n=1 Tax=uncultured Croceicoccus sp. TaxID=1295329 RepID=UPI002605FD82|nr:NUDIX domain-containing protein [uncultured Croceicoccus sp.]